MNDPRFDVASAVIAQARAARRGALSEPEGKLILSSLGIDVPGSRLIDDEVGVDQACTGLRPPFALKVVSDQVLHKTDLGGVALHLRDADAVRSALRTMRERLSGSGVHECRWLIEEMASPGVEVVVGAVTDPEFGPMVMVGLGGVFVEVLKDVAFRICPIDPADAREMIFSLRGAPLLSGARGRPVASIDSIVDVLMKLGGPDGLMTALSGAIAEVDINPLIVSTHSATAVDARFILNS